MRYVLGYHPASGWYVAAKAADGSKIFGKRQVVWSGPYGGSDAARAQAEAEILRLSKS